MPRSVSLVLIRFRSVCAWCSSVEEPGTPNAPVSHTICVRCAEALYFSSPLPYPSSERSTLVG